MLQDPFFTHIDQAVCLITRCEGDDCIKDYIIEFNSAFRQIFPAIHEANIFHEFSSELQQFIENSFVDQEPQSEIKFSLHYQNKDYDVLRQGMLSKQFAFLFKEQNQHKVDSSVSKAALDFLGKNEILNFNTSTFEDASSMVIITDLEGKAEYVNKKFTEISGYSFDEAVGNKTNFLNSGMQSDAFYKQMWKTILSGQIWNNSFHNKKKSGQLYWQRTQIIPLRDQFGKVNRFLATAEDISEGKSIEIIMEEKSDLLFQLIEGTPDIVCIKDGDGRWLMANKANLKMFELEGINYYGKTAVELAELTSFYREALMACVVSDNEAWASRKMVRKDEIVRFPDGGEVVLDTLKIPYFNSDGTRKYLIVFGRDISIRKKAIEDLEQIEKRYALAQRAGGIASWEWDLDTRSLNWAENLEEIFGSSDLFQGKKIRSIIEYIHPDDRFFFLRKIMNVIRNTEDYDFDIRIYDVNQNVKWVKISGHVKYDKLKRKYLLLGIVYDITERKNYVRDIIEAKMNAEESDRLKSTFLATMSHELRTPLNAVIGFSDLIQGYELNSEVREFVNLIHNNGYHLLNLIEDIFDLSLIESNQVKIHKAKFDVIQILQDLADIMPVEIAKFNKINKIEFINNLPDKQIVLNSDSSRITQIISNLLKNAIKFTPSGIVKLDVRESGNDIVICVEDTGIGINKEKQKIIFEIFRQGEESLTRQFGGAGLGLSLSHNLTELLGGKLWVDSVEGKGSVFSFKIAKDENEYEKDENKFDKAVQTVDWSNKYVLVAEDEFSNYELLTYILKPTKIRIKNVTNGNQAIDEVLNVERPDLVLMDIKMPVLNGFEATKSIKEVYPDLPIIAQTAFAISGDKELALATGCDAYISKPIKKLDLIELMKNYLSS